MTPEVYFLVGCLPYSTSGSGFCLPVFSRGASQSNYIQSVNLRLSSVESFLPIDLDRQPLVEAEYSRPIRAGDVPIFAFRDISAFVHSRSAGRSRAVRVGTLDEIREFVEHHSVEARRLPVALQLQELLGSSGTERRTAREKLLSKLPGAESAIAKKCFLTSAFLESAWSNLARCFNDEIGGTTLRSVYRDVVAWGDMGSPNLFPDHVWRKIMPIIKVDMKSLIEMILSEMPTAEIATEAPGALSPQDAALVDGLLERLREESHEVGRLSIIISELLHRPRTGRYLVSIYRDRANGTERALEVLRSRIGDFGSARHLEVFVAHFVSKLPDLYGFLSIADLRSGIVKHLAPNSREILARHRCLPVVPPPEAQEQDEEGEKNTEFRGPFRASGR